jgi:hypothetical protein
LGCGTRMGNRPVRLAVRLTRRWALPASSHRTSHITELYPRRHGVWRRRSRRLKQARCRSYASAQEHRRSLKVETRVRTPLGVLTVEPQVGTAFVALTWGFLVSGDHLVVSGSCLAVQPMMGRGPEIVPTRRATIRRLPSRAAAGGGLALVQRRSGPLPLLPRPCWPHSAQRAVYVPGRRRRTRVSAFGSSMAAAASVGERSAALSALSRRPMTRSLVSGNRWL